jgi:hypothetical protein
LLNGPKTESYRVFKEFTKDPQDFYPKEANWWQGKDAQVYRNLNSTLFIEALACCCSVTYVNGMLIGDPLDVKMFESTNWILDEGSNSESG